MTKSKNLRYMGMKLKTEKMSRRTSIIEIPTIVFNYLNPNWKKTIIMRVKI